MANIFQPWPGPFAYDLQTLQGVLVGAVPGKTRGLCREKEGVDDAISEVSKSVPVHAVTLGIAADTHTRINTLTDQLTLVRAARADIDKLAEVLEETEIYLEDERETQFGTLVEAVRKAARRKDPAVLASFKETIRYHGQIGVRANKTRRKNAAAAAEAEAEAEAEADAEGHPDAR